MSVEALVITSVVRNGVDSLRKCYKEGINQEYFSIYDEEWGWIERQLAKRRPVTPRVFKRRFPDFEWLPTDEELDSLLDSLKDERAFIDVNAIIETASNELRVDNAAQVLTDVRDNTSQILRRYFPTEEMNLVADWRDHYENQKVLRSLRGAGKAPGIPTGFKWLDFHWDGFTPGRMTVVLGRPGDGKSYLIMYWVWHAIKNGFNVLFFSPEMSQFEHTCRLHTLASADPDVKAALGLRHSFRNRALMNGMGYNMKSYRQFCEYLHENCGEITMPVGTRRRIKMTPAFIEGKIDQHKPDLVIVDPIYKIKAPVSRRTQFEELSDVSDLIQDLAETYDVPIVVSNQAHRQQSKKEDAPHKDSSFNSDVPIQEADHVVGVKHISEEHRMIVRCTKSRFGEDFRFECAFWPNTGLMRELDAPTGSYYNGSDDDVEEEDLRQIIENTKEVQHAD